MSRKISIFSAIVTYLVTIGLFVLIVLIGQRYYDDFWSTVFLMVIGAILSIIMVTFFHEIGHVIGGKATGFEFVSMNVFFFKWLRVNGNIQFFFSGFGGELGYTEMIPKTKEKMEKR